MVMQLSDNSIRDTFSKRLLQARKMLGLSLRELAEKLGDSGVSYNALHKYETGRMMPSSGVLIMLSDVLGQPADFFLHPLKVNLEHIEFRKRTALGMKQEDAISQKASEFFERYMEIEEALGVAGKFKNPFSEYPHVKTSSDIEQAAIFLRKQWNLGIDALPGVLTLLEEKHIKIYEIDASDKFDGFSGWAGDVPVIVLNRNFPDDRKRLSALHELGHLLLSFPKDSIDSKTGEKFCTEFAGAMLLPNSVLFQNLGRTRTRISLEELEEIKTRFGISCAAIMMRALKLGIFTSSFMKNFWIKWRKLGLNQCERVKWGIPETPKRFNQLILRGVSEELISESKAASLLNEPLAAFRKRMGILS
jgi:Zn-dependent peptidase ImmA (M78 family)/DNA-binding XRE family transcriptional regulator